jgi:Aspartyl protease
LSRSHRVLIVALGLVLSAVTRAAWAAAEPPHINKPRPVPPSTPSTVPPLPPASFDNKLAIGGDDLKAKKVSTRLGVDVMVNGHGPYRFLVDSGADTSVVGLKIAHDLELPLGTPAILDGTTDRSLVDRVKVAELTLGPSTITNLELPALKEDDVGGEGLIGIDALVKERLMMDFEQRIIKVEDARTPIKTLPGDIVIVGIRRRGQLILTEVRASGLAVEAVIDTGSEVTIGNSALRDKLLRSGREKMWTVPATGVTGVTVQLEMARVRELQLGPITLQDVPIAFADVPPFKLFGLDQEPALLLGTDLLETFRRVSLDFMARKVRFQLRRCKSNAIFLSTSPSEMATRISANQDPDVCG